MVLEQAQGAVCILVSSASCREEGSGCDAPTLLRNAVCRLEVPLVGQQAACRPPTGQQGPEHPSDGALLLLVS